jgi:hypothetical protein
MGRQPEITSKHQSRAAADSLHAVAENISKKATSPLWKGGFLYA